MSDYLARTTPIAAHTDLTALMKTGSFPTELAEAFVSGKDPDLPSEDILAVTPYFLAVFDGMSSPLRAAGSLGSGRAFAEVAARTLVDLPANATARDAINAISTAQMSIHTEHPGPSGAVAAILSLTRMEVWRVGDVHIRIGEQHLPAHKDVDDALAQFRAAINAAHLADGMTLTEILTTDPGLAAAAPLLKLQPALANRDVAYGYGVLNGTNVPDRFLEVHHIPDATVVVLASDGYLAAESALQLAEEHLRTAINHDPAGVNELRDFAKTVVPGKNAPDDRSYLRTTPLTSPFGRST
ncbi:hypothetical protein [Subtercola sp. RTI3]|uniref:hypothetical protein n=1 Tax=Subtercola sp. RTI3 TaxID=3048639 RepID=UPI002B227EFC|nr:hypothetical protein [Subtercola sp. RTI3]MEA9987053.1 hypothetical protein [Subtercola sp. RTI3]